MRTTLVFAIFSIRMVFADQDSGTIHLRVLSSFGDEVSGYHLSLRTVDGKAVAHKSLKGGHLQQVPFGEYLLSVQTDCCRTIQHLVLNVPDLWIAVGVPVRFGDLVNSGGDLTVKGQVAGGRPGVHWVRIRGKFLGVVRESPIQKEKRFRIAGLDMGSYTLEVLERKRVVFSQDLELDPGRRIVALEIALRETKNRN